MRRFLVVPVLGAALLAMAPAAQAEFAVFLEPTTQTSAAPAGAGRVTFYGKPGDTQLVVQGAGNNVPLREALKTVVPPGWHGLAEKGVNTNMPVAWQGGDTWIQVLERLASEQSLLILVDWDARRIFLKPAPRTELAAAPAEAGTPGWTVKPGDTLKSTLSRWAEQAHWQLSWETDFDYPMPLGATFSGSFGEAGAQLIGHYQTAKKPLKIIFYKGNSVARVLQGD